MEQINFQDFNREYCPVFKAVSEIGDAWTILIIRECFLGVRRFDDFQHNLSISKSVLSAKIKKLLAVEILEKRSYQEENQRARYEYRLTSKGKNLYLVLVSLLQWGNQYLQENTPECLMVKERKNKNSTRLAILNKKGKELSRKEIQLLTFRK